MKRLRIYIDTSVVGGCFDSDFETESRALFDMIKAGRLIAVVSSLLADELRLAPSKVQAILVELPSKGVESITVDLEAISLRDAYLAAGVVGDAQSNDALHVALATVARADMIVSWNFKHIVKLKTIRGVNGINRMLGFKEIEILTPQSWIQEDNNE